jgi:hypothetical protein
MYRIRIYRSLSSVFSVNNTNNNTITVDQVYFLIVFQLPQNKASFIEHSSETYNAYL